MDKTVPRDPSLPLARCPQSDIEAYGYPFFIRPSQGMEPPFLFLEIHLEFMTTEEREWLGEAIAVRGPEDLARLAFPRDDRGVVIIQD